VRMIPIPPHHIREGSRFSRYKWVRLCTPMFVWGGSIRSVVLMSAAHQSADRYLTYLGYPVHFY
jgi:hypothetical protein